MQKIKQMSAFCVNSPITMINSLLLTSHLLVIFNMEEGGQEKWIFAWGLCNNQQKKNNAWQA